MSPNTEFKILWLKNFKLLLAIDSKLHTLLSRIVLHSLNIGLNMRCNEIIGMLIKHAPYKFNQTISEVLRPVPITLRCPLLLQKFAVVARTATGNMNDVLLTVSHHVIRMVYGNFRTHMASCFVKDSQKDELLQIHHVLRDSRTRQVANGVLRNDFCRTMYLEHSCDKSRATLVIDCIVFS